MYPCINGTYCLTSLYWWYVLQPSMNPKPIPPHQSIHIAIKPEISDPGLGHVPLKGAMSPVGKTIHTSRALWTLDQNGPNFRFPLLVVGIGGSDLDLNLKEPRLL